MLMNQLNQLNQLNHLRNQVFLPAILVGKLSNKYIYPRGNEYQTASYYLFSDQSILHYIAELEHRYNGFFDLIHNENVKKENFAQYQINELDWLFEHEYILYNDNGFIILMEKRCGF